MKPEFPIFVIFACLMSLLAGCAAGPAPAPSGDDRAILERRALILIDEGRFREAAQEYLRLARTNDAPLSHEFVLSAGRALIEEGDLAASRRLVDDVLPSK
ncbi:MAG: hypothetical protein R3174_14715, partial [Gammaproteobacteria bacterium]|nr:hypothetical protein [Gammaproteobacteria bacterium]